MILRKHILLLLLVLIGYSLLFYWFIIEQGWMLIAIATMLFFVELLPALLIGSISPIFILVAIPFILSRLIKLLGQKRIPETNNSVES